MGIERIETFTVDMNRALSSESYAAQVIRSGKLSGTDRGQIVAKWGNDKIKSWESIDSTQYKIDDEDWDAAKAAGKDKAKEETGHDGSKESVLRVVGQDAASAVATGAMAVAGRKIINGICGAGSGGTIKLTKSVKDTNLFGQKIKEKSTSGKNASDLLTVALGVAAAANYHFNKPNEDQHDAAMKLYNAAEGSGVLADGQTSLVEAQELMEDATEQTTELTEEAQEVNEEANENIDDNKTNLDFFRRQYEFLKAKAQSGEPLTPDEKQVMKKLAPVMEQAVTSIEDAQTGASKDLEDKYGQIEAFEGTYDEGAETIAEVQGVTDFAEGFDSATRTMAYVEGFSQGITGTMTGLAAARLATKGGLSFGVTLAAAAAGGVAAVRLGFASAEQFKFAGEIGDEIHYREDTQDLGDETFETYETELDNFTGNMDIIDDMELEVPEDVAIPEPVAETGDDGGEVDVDETGEEGGLENDPDYTGVMGKGSDYSDIIAGKAKRKDDDKLVTNEDGKVVLTSAYSNAISSVTGDNTGEGYDSGKIPAIIAKLLGDPFTEATINNLKNGGQVNSEFAAKILKTKTGQETGETTNTDNTQTATQKANDVINFYWPIFEKAATGWVKG